MTQPVASLTQASLEQLYGVFADDKTLAGSRRGVSILNELVGLLNRTYVGAFGAVLDIAITDGTDASPTAFLSGEGAALSGAGAVFRTTGTTDDFTDNALATAKGSAVAAYDVFVMASGTTVAYLGNQPSTVAVAQPFDFAGELESDFVSIGS